MWIVALAPMALGLLLIVRNGEMILRRKGSLVPLLGAGLVALGLFLAPAPLNRWLWVPFVVDPGSVLLLLMVLVFWIRRALRH